MRQTWDEPTPRTFFQPAQRPGSPAALTARSGGDDRQLRTGGAQGGRIDAARRQWRKVKGRYLFNAFALARVFRAKLLRALSDAGLSIPVGLPAKWVVDCRAVGSGEPALEYLSRYLYRGVIRERDLVDYDAAAGIVTFRYSVFRR